MTPPQPSPPLQPDPGPLTGTVVSVSRDDRHGFSKPAVGSIILRAGYGVEGDAHAGATTQHRYLLKKDPARANLTQVHLLPAELFAELPGSTVPVGPGDLGENVTTRGLLLRTLPRGTRLHLGADAVVEVTGLRSPCSLINGFRPGLMKALLGTDAAGLVERRAGIMSIVTVSGTVQPGDRIRVELPAGEPVPLGVV
ncbi:MAG: MOSC domain-containing protein [Cryobacterium sp.]